VFENSVIARSRKAPWSAKVYFALLIAIVIYIVIFGCSPRLPQGTVQPVTGSQSISGTALPSEKTAGHSGAF